MNNTTIAIGREEENHLQVDAEENDDGEEDGVDLPETGPQL
jgi:hypothetical protein